MGFCFPGSTYKMIKGFALASLFHKSCIFFSYAKANLFAGFINVVVSFPPMFDGLHSMVYSTSYQYISRIPSRLPFSMLLSSELLFQSGNHCKTVLQRIMLFILYLPYTVLRFVWVSAKFGTCTVAHFSFKKCPIYTHESRRCKCQI